MVSGPEQPDRLSGALVVVRSTGRYAPETRPRARSWPASSRSRSRPGQPVRVPVESPKGPAWLACFVDPGAPATDAAGVLLFPPPAEEMRIR